MKIITTISIIKRAIVIYVFPTPLSVPNQASSLFINSPVAISDTITPTTTKPMVDGLTFMSINPIKIVRFCLFKKVVKKVKGIFKG